MHLKKDVFIFMHTNKNGVHEIKVKYVVKKLITEKNVWFIV